MKELLEIFIYKPKKTEKIVIAILKLVFTLSFSIWIYEEIGVKDISQNLTELVRLKLFILNGHILLFAFTYYILFALFFKLSGNVFSILGFLSYWSFRLIWFIIANSLDLLVSIVRFVRKKGWKFSLKSDFNVDDGFFSFSHTIVKYLLSKAGMLKNKRQRLRDSKQLNLMIQLARKALIEDKEVIYDKIHIVFIFSVLFYIFYFYHLKTTTSLIPQVDFLVRFICISSCIIQLVIYWVYSHFRLIYYFYLVFYRGIHSQDMIKMKMDDYARTQSEEIEKNMQAAIDGVNLEEMENQE